MKQQDAIILKHLALQNGHWKIDLSTTAQFAKAVNPGQFVHVELPDTAQHLLRRPFSIFDTDTEHNRISIIYKVVGQGTQLLSQCDVRRKLNILGPLGRGFTLCSEQQQPVIVAGGYGAAATHLLARRLPRPAVVLLGGARSEDLICIEDFEQLGCTVIPVTEDGSRGHQGMVTDFLPDILSDAAKPPAVYACGPAGMLRAVSDMVLSRDMDAEISLEHRMCCGVGACFACVVKIKDPAPPGWRYARTCREGPVFKASEAYWE